MEIWKQLREIQNAIDEGDFWNEGDRAVICYTLPDLKHYLHIYVSNNNALYPSKHIAIEIVDLNDNICGESAFAPLDYPEELIITVAWILETQYCKLGDTNGKELSSM